MKAKEYDQVYHTDAASWREWLNENHQKVDGVWLIYYKKHSGKSRVPYDEAVEEALCFGWIDSTIRRLDEERYMQKFTPRKPKSTWSELNKQRVKKLVKTGKMTPAGMKIIEVAKANGKWNEVVDAKKKFTFSKETQRMLKSSKNAFKNYKNLSPTQQRYYLQWVMSAKRPETQMKRCREMIELLEEGRKLGMK